MVIKLRWGRGEMIIRLIEFGDSEYLRRDRQQCELRYTNKSKVGETFEVSHTKGRKRRL